MPTLGKPSCLDVRFPQLICDDQSDFWVLAQNPQRSIRTRVIIGDDGIDLFADVVQCVLENKRFIANAGDSN